MKAMAPPESRLADSVCSRAAIKNLSSGVSGDNCGSPQEPHNDQNRTTPGTNLLPSISRVRVKPKFASTSAARAGDGW
jgi:hypothetical protein